MGRLVQMGIVRRDMTACDGVAPAGRQQFQGNVCRGDRGPGWKSPRGRGGCEPADRDFEAYRLPTRHVDGRFAGRGKIDWLAVDSDCDHSRLRGIMLRAEGDSLEEDPQVFRREEAQQPPDDHGGDQQPEPCQRLARQAAITSTFFCRWATRSMTAVCNCFEPQRAASADSNCKAATRSLSMPACRWTKQRHVRHVLALSQPGQREAGEGPDHARP